MDPNPALRRDHCLRSHGDWVKVSRYSLNRNEFMLRSDLTYRIYAITGKNKSIGGSLALVITAELFYGIFSAVWIGLGPCESLDSLPHSRELMLAFSATVARD